MKPIILTADEVRAALAGTLTELRRPVKFPGASRIAPYPFARQCDDGGWCFADALLEGILWETLRVLPGKVSPFGVPGDVLFGQEAWAAHWMYDDAASDKCRSPWAEDNYWYQADGDDAPGSCGCPAKGRRGIWRPAETMPEWASRLTLVTRAVRVEQMADVWTWIGAVEVLHRDGQPIPPREVQS